MINLKKAGYYKMTEQHQQRYRFSEAPIWSLQRKYYEDAGLEAWRNDQVPQYITSNPATAIAYAEMIFAFLQDQMNQGLGAEPVYIVELGAGAGRLAYHVLYELQKLKEYAGIDVPEYHYVMTDLAMNNVIGWREHSALQPFIEQGILDFAQFDAVQSDSLHLTVSGKVIQQGDLTQPLLIIANYFFDAIPQELIYVDEGSIYEADVYIEYSKTGAEFEALTTSQQLNHIHLSYEYRKAPEYEQDDYIYRDLIAIYQERLEDAHILFPKVGLECLDRLDALSQSGFMLLTADKGDHLIENWEFAEPPELVLHGSFSLIANYHAVQYVFEQKGAEILFVPHHYNNINVGCILHVAQPKTYTNTRLAYRRSVERFGPDDFFSLKMWIDRHLDELGMQQILSFWRLGGYDAEFFIQTTKQISALLPEANDEEKKDLWMGIQKMWSAFYVMPQRYDLALDAGLILFEMDMFQEAKQYLEISVAQEQEEVVSTVYYCLAIACLELDLMDQAEEYLKQLLVLEPDHEEALALMSVLMAEE